MKFSYCNNPFIAVVVETRISCFSCEECQYVTDKIAEKDKRRYSHEEAVFDLRREKGVKMNITIRKMLETDRTCVCEMMRTFYASPAVLSNGSEEIFQNDIENCVNDSPYLEGYIFQEGQEIQGYAMVAKSFSTEFGKPCMWIEDLYLKPEYRGMGIGSQFFAFISAKYSDAILRLEVEEENKRAIHVYKKAGFEVLPYMEMKKENA